jgi:hypothetical protein
MIRNMIQLVWCLHLQLITIGNQITRIGSAPYQKHGVSLQGCTANDHSTKPKHQQSHNIRNKTREDIYDLKYIGITITNSNESHDEIRGRINSGNACHHSVRKLYIICLFSKTMTIRIYITVFLCTYFIWVWNMIFNLERRKNTR